MSVCMWRKEVKSKMEDYKPIKPTQIIRVSSKDAKFLKFTQRFPFLRKKIQQMLSRYGIDRDNYQVVISSDCTRLMCFER